MRSNGKLRTWAMVKNDVGDLFTALRLILDGEFVDAQRYLFHAGWTPNDIKKENR